MSCENCAHSKPRLQYLGFRPWCKLYKKFTTLRCVDFRPKPA